MYDKVTCCINDRIEVEKHYPARYGAPGMSREERSTPTPEDMARQNYWRRRRELRRIIELNFREGDYHVILTCRKELRPTMEEAPRVIRKFRDKLGRAYKKWEWEYKYVITCETGSRGAVHWHMIINNMHNEITSTAKLIHKLWSRGRPKLVMLDDTGDYKLLADYIIKECDMRVRTGQTIEKLSYMRSRNLKKPVIRKEKIRSNRWFKNPTIPKGWHLIPGSLYNGHNKFTGLPFQYYSIAKGELTEARRRRYEEIGSRYEYIPEEVEEYADG